MESAILTIGTEITDGEVLNKNSYTIAQLLCDLQIQVKVHLSVPDDYDQMYEAIGQCAKQAKLIVITGGLGPTKDDFTRTVVADWAENTFRLLESYREFLLQTLK